MAKIKHLTMLGLDYYMKEQLRESEDLDICQAWLEGFVTGLLEAGVIDVEDYDKWSCEPGNLKEKEIERRING